MLTPSQIRNRPRLLPPEDNPDDLIEGLISDAIAEIKTPLSNCCDMPFIETTDFCMDCLEHASGRVGVRLNPLSHRDHATYADVTFDVISGEVQEYEITN